jgi:hypothetical protein
MEVSMTSTDASGSTSAQMPEAGTIDMKLEVADGADEVELLGLIQRADGDQDGPDGLGALRDAVHRRTLDGDVVGQAVQPRRVVVGEAASGIAAFQVWHAVPPSECANPLRVPTARARRTSEIPWL